MPTGNPPAYDAAVTNPTGNTNVITQEPSSGAEMERSRTNETVSTISSADLRKDSLVDEDEMRELDDEQRDLPQGWVRCFDPNTKHHFYVEEATKRSIWTHPYDDPDFLKSLPKDHPANPDSKEGQAVRQHVEQEKAQAKQRSEQGADHNRSGFGGGAAAGGYHQSSENRNWIQKKKDQLIGTKEERAAAKEEKRKRKEEERRRIRQAEQEYLKRRQELMQQQLNNPRINRYYASNPYGYSAPMSPFSRGGMYGSPYGYGYGGGYGRRGYGGYGGGMGMGMPLMGGMAGGLLLGSAMGGGFGGYGGYGGGFGGDCGGGGDMGGGGDGGGGM